MRGGSRDVDGWVKLHRVLIDKPIWRLPDAQRIVFVTVLLMASHCENSWFWKGKKFHIKPGQFITSLESLAGKAGVSVRSVRTSLANLEKLDFLTNESTKTGRLITVVNWALYQSCDYESTIKSTIDRQSTDKAPTTIKNDKNDKNEKEKEIYREVLDYLNQKAGTKYRMVEAHKKLIRAREKEGYSLTDFQTVIDNKVADWLGTDQQKYLRPETLFGTKFDGYLNRPEGVKRNGNNTVHNDPERPRGACASDIAGKIPEGFWR